MGGGIRAANPGTENQPTRVIKDLITRRAQIHPEMDLCLGHRHGAVRIRSDDVHAVQLMMLDGDPDTLHRPIVSDDRIEQCGRTNPMMDPFASAPELIWRRRARKILDITMRTRVIKDLIKRKE